jgi:riboflavin kinase/FMN adenylyltransferase
LLGYDYFFEGTVVEGKRIGRRIGYRTANVLVEDEEKLVPGYGVYAVEVSLDKEVLRLKGMMNIGTNPTVGGTTRTIEVNIFEFNEDVYRRRMRVFVKAFLRPEIKFDGIEELVNQLAQDKVDAIAKLK